MPKLGYGNLNFNIAVIINHFLNLSYIKTVKTPRLAYLSISMVNIKQSNNSFILSIDSVDLSRVFLYFNLIYLNNFYSFYNNNSNTKKALSMIDKAFKKIITKLIKTNTILYNIHLSVN